VENRGVVDKKESGVYKGCGPPLIKFFSLLDSQEKKGYI